MLAAYCSDGGKGAGSKLDHAGQIAGVRPHCKEGGWRGVIYGGWQQGVRRSPGGEVTKYLKNKR